MLPPPMLPYVATTFAGAFLLFFCQPMMGRFLLPWFGGGAAVWTVTLLFFQVGLVLGYGYAHLMSRLRPWTQVRVHGGLFLLAALTIGVVPGEEWRPVGTEEPTWAALRILAVHIGLPYVLLSATAPLVQSWFAREMPQRSPYGLYATSNLASLLALFGYPFLFEPRFGRQEQALAWQAGFAAVALGLVLLGWRMSRAAAESPRAADGPAEGGHWRVSWLVLPALSSGLLLAVTNRLSENVPPFPFLWVVPLGLHLASFVLCFRDRPLYRRGPFVLLFVAGVAVLTWEQQGTTPGFLFHLLLLCTVLFSACMSLHGELYRLRPPAQRLTGYYLAIAIGGALGGVFVAVLSPVVFDQLIEFPLLLLGVGAAQVVCSFSETRNTPLAVTGGVAWLVLGVFLFLPELQEQEGLLHRSRNFYGTQTVKLVEEGEPDARYEYGHGVITHGIQYQDERVRHLPTAYFTSISGVGMAWNDLPSDRSRKVAVIGLGIGTLAAYGRPGDRIRFYELDPKVCAVADELFTYLRESEAETEVVLGDGRSRLESEPEQGFDLIVLDAFSGDAPPAHLLTIEAFELYRRHLRPGGLIAVNVTNRYLDLLDLVARQARELGLAGVWVGSREDSSYAALKATWALLAEERSSFGPTVLESAHPLEEEAERSSVWTDDFSAPKEILEWW